MNIRPIHPVFFSRSSARAFVLSLFRAHVRIAIEAAFPTTCSSLVTSPASSFLFLSGMESVSAGRVQAITGAILSYSSSASAPNLDPIAFKEAALARLRNVAVSFESGAVRSTLVVALAACLLGCPQDPKEKSFPTQKGTHEANLMLSVPNRSEASSVGGPS